MTTKILKPENENPGSPFKDPKEPIDPTIPEPAPDEPNPYPIPDPLPEPNPEPPPLPIPTEPVPKFPPDVVF